MMFCIIYGLLSEMSQILSHLLGHISSVHRLSAALSHEQSTVNVHSMFFPSQHPCPLHFPSVRIRRLPVMNNRMCVLGCTCDFF